MSDELEAQIYENPDDPAAYIVFGDWLQDHGDPRGKLIAAQAARLAAQDSAELAAAEAAILAEHRDVLLGPELGIVPEPHVEWYLGFWRALHVGGFGWTERPPTAAHVEQLLAMASARFLRELAAGGGVSVDVLAMAAGKYRTIERIDVSIRDDEITDAAIRVLEPCTRLQSLKLFSCPSVTSKGIAVLQSFRQLRELDLRNCPLSDKGARHLDGLPLERVMFNAVDGLTDAGMRVFANAPLVSLDLDGDTIDDACFEPLAGHPTLVNLEIGGAPITAMGTRGIAAMPKLRRLYLRSSETLGDAGVHALAAHRELRALYLGHCRTLTDASCEALGRMTSLRFLDIKSNAITGAGLRTLRGLDELRVLDLAFLELDDAAVRELVAFPKLTGLNLAFSPITDASVDVLVRLEGLEELDISGTGITAAGIERLAQLPNLTELGLEDCAPDVIEAARAVEHWSVSTRDLLELWDDEGLGGW